MCNLCGVCVTTGFCQIPQCSTLTLPLPVAGRAPQPRLRRAPRRERHAAAGDAPVNNQAGDEPGGALVHPLPLTRPLPLPSLAGCAARGRGGGGRAARRIAHVLFRVVRGLITVKTTEPQPCYCTLAATPESPAANSWETTADGA